MRWSMVSALPRIRASYLGLSSPTIEAPHSTGFHNILAKEVGDWFTWTTYKHLLSCIKLGKGCTWVG